MNGEPDHLPAAPAVAAMPAIRSAGAARPPVLSNSPDASSGDEAGHDDSAAARFASAIFESYAAACRQGPGGGGSDDEGEQLYEAGLARVSESLLGAAQSACLICLESIRPAGGAAESQVAAPAAPAPLPPPPAPASRPRPSSFAAADPTWHCAGGCYEVVHLHCIQGWARQQLAAAAARADARLDPGRFPSAAAEARAAATWGEAVFLGGGGGHFAAGPFVILVLPPKHAAGAPAFCCRRPFAVAGLLHRRTTGAPPPPIPPLRLPQVPCPALPGAHALPLLLRQDPGPAL